MPLAARRLRAALPLTLLLALALLPSGCDSSCSFEPIGCYKDQGSPRTLRWHLDGCPTADAFGPESPSPRPAPKCDPKLVSVEYCAEQCAAWNPWAGGSEFYVGLESGVGVPDARPDYAECMCDVSLRGPAASLGPSPAGTTCPAKCPGAEPGSAERCGNAPGTWAINIYKVDCGSGWGLVFLILLGVGSVGYVGGGVGWSVRVQGSAPALESHPHYALWGQVGGLVTDGVRFTQARMQGQQGQAEDGLREGLAPKSASGAREGAQEAAPTAAAGAAEEGGSSEDEDEDELVE